MTNVSPSRQPSAPEIEVVKKGGRSGKKEEKIQLIQCVTVNGLNMQTSMCAIETARTLNTLPC